MKKVVDFNHGDRVAMITWWHKPPGEHRWDELMNQKGEIPCKARIDKVELYEKSYEPTVTVLAAREIHCMNSAIDEIKDNEPYWVPHEQLV